MAISDDYNGAGSKVSDQTGALEYLTKFLSNPEYDNYISGEPEEHAARLLDEYGTLGRVLSEPKNLKTRGDLSHNVAEGITDLYNEYCQSLKDNLIGCQYDESDTALKSYLYGRFSCMPIERFGVLHLDETGKILDIEDQQTGWVTGTGVISFGKLAANAAQANASAIVLMHNHPSGAVEPSRDIVSKQKSYGKDGTGQYSTSAPWFKSNVSHQEKIRKDIGMTAIIKIAMNAVSVELHDNLIVGRGKTFSFRDSEHHECVNAEHKFEQAPKNPAPKQGTEEFAELRNILEKEYDQGVSAPKFLSYKDLFDYLRPEHAGSVIYFDNDNRIINHEAIEMDAGKIATRAKELRASGVVCVTPYTKTAPDRSFEEIFEEGQTDFEPEGIKDALEDEGISVCGVITPDQIHAEPTSGLKND